MVNCNVYWLHLEEHTDIFSQGYVGVSVNPKYRFISHKSSIKNKTHSNKCLIHAFEKYNEQIIQTIILEAHEEYCYEIENKLRPNKHIGWNIAVGGLITHQNFGDTSGANNAMYGKQHTIEAKLKMSDTKKSNYKIRYWWNDGETSTMSTTPPNENYTKGRLNSHITNKTKPRGVAHLLKPVQTPLGVFKSVTEAAEAKGVSKSRMVYYLKSPSEKYKDFFYI